MLSLSRWRQQTGAVRALREGPVPCRLWLRAAHYLPGCPLSAGLQVLVREHVELAVQPAGFIPEQFGFALK